MNTKFEGAINTNNTIPLAEENLYRLFCSIDKLPLLLSRETILFDHLQQEDFKGVTVGGGNMITILELLVIITKQLMKILENQTSLVLEVQMF